MIMSSFLWKITQLSTTMKTPERWRPSRVAPSLSVFLPKDLLSLIRPWHLDVTWRHDFTWQLCHGNTGLLFLRLHHQKVGKSHFFNVATLTFDLRPWPSNSSKILSRSIPTSNFRSLSQTVQPWERWITDRHTNTQTHRQTGPILYPRPLTREGIIYGNIWVKSEDGLNLVWPWQWSWDF